MRRIRLSGIRKKLTATQKRSVLCVYLSSPNGARLFLYALYTLKTHKTLKNNIVSIIRLSSASIKQIGQRKRNLRSSFLGSYIRRDLDPLHTAEPRNPTANVGGNDLKIKNNENIPSATSQSSTEQSTSKNNTITTTELLKRKEIEEQFKAATDHIHSLQKSFSCGMIDAEKLQGEVSEMEDKRKKLLKKLHPYSIKKIISTDGTKRERIRTRWTTRLQDETQKNGYRLVRASDEETLYLTLYRHYGLLPDRNVPKGKAPAVSLEGLYDHWIQYRLLKVRPGTVKKDMATWKKYFEGEPITRQRLDSIKASEAFRWLSEKVTTYHLSYRQYSEIRGLWNQIESFAFNDDLINRRLIHNLESPAKSLFARNEARYREDATFSKDELRMVYDTAEVLYHKSHFNTAYLGLILDIFLGFRANEIVCLKWSCIDTVKKTVTITQSESPKYDLVDGRMVWNGYEVMEHLKCGHIERTVPLPPEAEKILGKIRKENLKHGVLSEYVFVQKNGERIHTRSFQKALNKVYKELGWENKTGGMHEFRRTYATSLIGNVSDKSVQQWMGHKDWHTTMQYYEYVEKTPDPDAAATVSQAIWG